MIYISKPTLVGSGKLARSMFIGSEESLPWVRRKLARPTVLRSSILDLASMSDLHHVDLANFQVHEHWQLKYP